MCPPLCKRCKKFKYKASHFMIYMIYTRILEYLLMDLNKAKNSFCPVSIRFRTFMHLIEGRLPNSIIIDREKVGKSVISCSFWPIFCWGWNHAFSLFKALISYFAKAWSDLPYDKLQFLAFMTFMTFWLPSQQKYK